jgi:hypothetical protein
MNEAKTIISEIDRRIEKAECRLHRHKINLQTPANKAKIEMLKYGIIQERETICELKDLRTWIYNNIPGIPTTNS